MHPKRRREGSDTGVATLAKQFGSRTKFLEVGWAQLQLDSSMLTFFQRIFVTVCDLAISWVSSCSALICTTHVRLVHLVLH